MEKADAITKTYDCKYNKKSPRQRRGTAHWVKTYIYHHTLLLYRCEENLNNIFVIFSLSWWCSAIKQSSASQ